MREGHLRRRHRQSSQRVREQHGILLGEPPLGSRRERRRAEAEEALALVREPLAQPGRGLLHAPVLGEAPCELLGRLLGLELGELGVLLREELARLDLEQRRDEDEELAARVEVDLVARGQVLDERHDDGRDVDLRRLELVLEDQRQEEVERALEGVEVQLEVANRRRHGVNLAGRSDALALRDGHLAGRRGRTSGASSAAGARAGHPAARGRTRSRLRRSRAATSRRSGAAPRCGARGRCGGAPRRSALGSRARCTRRRFPAGAAGTAARSRRRARPPSRDPRSARRGTSGGTSCPADTGRAGRRSRAPTAGRWACRRAPGSTSCRDARSPARSGAPARGSRRAARRPRPRASRRCRRRGSRARCRPTPRGRRARSRTRPTTRPAPRPSS